VTPEARLFLDKAQKCLNNARTVLAIGLGDDAGRGAYLAGFHAAQALIFEVTGRSAKTHNGVQTLFVNIARKDPRMPPGLLSFLSQAYHLKAVADYETGPGSSVPIDKAAAAIQSAAGLIECVTEILTGPSGGAGRSGGGP
jgi:uncharacterized protein (UPF0332 family)